LVLVFSNANEAFAEDKYNAVIRDFKATGFTTKACS
jgi:hypothetical protein